MDLEPGKNEERRIAILAVTRKGSDLARDLCNRLGGDLFLPVRVVENPAKEVAYKPPLSSLVRKLFPCYTHLVFITSTGIAVRCIAPLLKDKRSDPGVIVIDERGLNVISLLGGHRRNSNRLAGEIAAMIGGNPVVTTASDLRGMQSLDTWIRDRGWRCHNEDQLPRILAALIDGEEVGLYQESGEEIFPGVIPPSSRVIRFLSLEEALSSPLENKIIVSDRRLDLLLAKENQEFLWVIPRTLVLGIGCRKGTGREDVEQAVRKCLQENNLCEESVFAVATLEIKKTEGGLLEFASAHDLETFFFSPHELREAPSFSASSQRTLEIAGVSPVCEKAALKACDDGELVVPKKVLGKVTVAVARKKPGVPGKKKGKLYLVGTGPGSEDLISPRASKALLHSSTIIGYTGYLGQVEKYLAGKRTIAGNMGKEKERARSALQLAARGNTVSLISGGDPGIYGMASYLGELLVESGLGKDVEVEVVPGIPAFCAAAARLGFPISGDFAVISLSDYHVDWRVIEKRLQAAAEADMVIVLYNPFSPQRREGLARAARIILRYRDGKTPVGMVRNATRKGEELAFLELRELIGLEADMNSLFIVGNSASRLTRWGIYTSRGDKGGGRN